MGVTHGSTLNEGEAVEELVGLDEGVIAHSDGR